MWEHHDIELNAKGVAFVRDPEGLCLVVAVGEATIDDDLVKEMARIGALA